MVHDEVIGIVGVSGKGIIFVEKINLSFRVRCKNGIIEVGEFGEIACDSIDDDGRVNFYMCLSRKIDVHSREHQQVILASRPVNP